MIQSERCRAIRNGILLIILYAVIFFFSAEDGESSSAVSTQVTKTLLKAYYAMSEGKGTGGGVTGDLVYALEGVIRKLAHFTEYVAGGMTAVAVLWIIKRLKRRLCTG